MPDTRRTWLDLTHIVLFSVIYSFRGLDICRRLPMAQCRTEGRKHPSAMDLYVGIFHSKLQSSTMEVDKYQPWARYGYGDRSISNPSVEKVSSDICHYPENNVNGHAKPSSSSPSLPPPPLSSSSSSSSPSSSSSLASHDKPDLNPPTKNQAKDLGPNVTLTSTNSHTNDHHPSLRARKSSEQTITTRNRDKNLNGNGDGDGDKNKEKISVDGRSHIRFYKSSEQATPKCKKDVKANEERPKSGNIEGRRWSSMGSVDCPLYVGGSPTSKDSVSRRSSCGSSDGGIPIVKDSENVKRSSSSSSSSFSSCSSAGHGLADPSCPGATNLNSKEISQISSSAKIIANGKESCPNASLRGMGNILGNGLSTSKPKGSMNKAGFYDKVVQSVAKTSDDVMHTANPNTVSINSSSGNNICIGNILNHGPVPRASHKLVEEPRNGPIKLDNPEEIKNAGNEMYKKGNFSEAVALYEKSIAMCPNHAAYRSNRAAALIGLGRLGEAVQECEEAIRLDPRYSRAQQRASHLYVRLGLIESAKRHLVALRQADAKDMQTLETVEKHISRCIEARKMGSWRNVLLESNAAIAAGADSAPQVLCYKSEALLKLHKPDEAETICVQAQKLETSLRKLGLIPADVFSYMLRAHIEMSLGRFSDAIRFADAAAKLDPRNPEAVVLLRKACAVGQMRTSGNDLFNAGKFFEACAAYGEGLESDPMNPVLLCNRAACRSKLGQWEKAIEDCDAALNAQPNYIKALMRRANCNAKLERWEDALRDYGVLRREMPNDVEVARGFFDVQTAIKRSRGEEIHRMRFGGDVEEVFDRNEFRAVTDSPGVSVVEFVTRRNDRCREISTFIDQLCKRYPCVHFVKVDVDENPVIAKAEGLTFIPTFKIYKNGHKLKEMLGPSEEALECAMKQYSS